MQPSLYWVATSAAPTDANVSHPGAAETAQLGVFSAIMLGRQK